MKTTCVFLIINHSITVRNPPPLFCQSYEKIDFEICEFWSIRGPLECSPLVSLSSTFYHWGDRGLYETWGNLLSHSAKWQQVAFDPRHLDCRQALNHYTTRGKKKKASFIASPELPWGESKINIFQLLITKSHHFLSYWCILISIKINQQPQHCPLLNLNHNTNSCTYIMHASGI